MVLKLWTENYQDAPTPITAGQPYILAAVQTEPVANLTLNPTGVDVQLYTPQDPPPRNLLQTLVPNDRLLLWNGYHPTGTRHSEPYLYLAYGYGVRPLTPGTLTLTVHNQQIQRTVQNPPPPPPNNNEPHAHLVHLETAYTGGGRRCVLAQIFIAQTPARLRAADLGGTSIAHLQTETPQGYRISVDYVDTDARIDLRHNENPNQTTVNQTLRVIAWLH